MNRCFCKYGLLIAFAFLFLSSCKGYKFQEDSLPEEVVEEVILYKTGADIDLTPSTKESGFTPKKISPVTKVE